MIEEVLPNVFRVEIPLPRNPLKAINSYVIKDPDRNLMVDTGMNRPECRDAVYPALQQLGIDLRKTDFFITHLHADHSGLIGELASESSTVYCSRPDADLLNLGAPWEEMLDFARRNGFPQHLLQDALFKHPGYIYRVTKLVDYTLVEEGDRVTVGDYRFRCLHTPGHTRGHTCLYEPEKRVLISGDHILGDITPNIAGWTPGENPLEQYLRSLDRVYDLEVDVALPGHRSIIQDCRGRIDELRRHHQARADEALSTVGREPRSAYKVAMEMTWDLKADSWEDFPVSQKWFASGEALSHLRYLEERGEVRTELRGDEIIYTR
jgi:glyoxylase-like metal-dependent hydrolase (beta-lactamase superfamily II)